TPHPARAAPAAGPPTWPAPAGGGSWNERLRGDSWTAPGEFEMGTEGRWARLRQPLGEVVADAERVGDDGQGGGHRRTGGEETTVDHVEVVHLVGPAVHVESGGGRIPPEADGPVLVGDSGQGDALPQEQVPGEDALVASPPVNGAAPLLLEEGF